MYIYIYDLVPTTVYIYIYIYISAEEIMTSYETPKIREKLNLIGIDRSDLHMMFKVYA